MDADPESLREKRERQRRLFETPVEQWADVELIEQLIERYTSDPVPPCRVCGGSLSIERAGGGEPTVWACSPWEDDPTDPGRLKPKAERNLVDDHYERSRWKQYRSGDCAVLDLIRRFRSLGTDAGGCHG